MSIWQARSCKGWRSKKDKKNLELIEAKYMTTSWNKQTKMIKYLCRVLRRMEFTKVIKKIL